MGYRAQLRASKVPKGEPQSKTMHASPCLAGPPIIQGLWTRPQAQARVSVRGKSRSKEYQAILNEFGSWGFLTAGRSAAVKYEYLIRLKERIEEYIQTKSEKNGTTARRQRVTSMGLLLQNVEEELVRVRSQGDIEPPDELVYLSGGEKSRNDPTIKGGLSSFGLMYGKRTINTGVENSLHDLGQASVIHVFGHSNYGTAIGSKEHNLTPSELVANLISDGLRPKHAITIRLAACGTGASVVKGGAIIENSKPFVEQVATLLAERGFQNATVVGYTAFVIPCKYPEAPEGKGRHVYARNESIHDKRENIVRLRDTEVVWTIRDGVANKSSGKNYEYSNPKKDYYTILPT